MVSGCSCKIASLSRGAGYDIVVRISFILHARPFTEPIENRIALFNEYLISIYIYGIFLLTDYNTSDELRYYVSLLLVGVIGVYILVNFGNFIILALI